jgi:hypothetical protein
MSFISTTPIVTDRMIEKYPDQVKQILDSITPLYDAITGFTNVVKDFTLNWITKILLPLLSFLWEIVNRVLYNIVNYYIKPISDAIMGAVNSVIKSMTDLFIKPIYDLYNTIMVRLRNKLKGLLYIMITTPLMIRATRRFAEEPSIRGLLKTLTIPLMSMVATEILYDVTFGFMPAPKFASPPSARVEIPAPSMYNYDISDVMQVSDSIDFEIIPPTTVEDSFAPGDDVTIEIVSSITTSDSFSPSDNVTVT